MRSHYVIEIQRNFVGGSQEFVDRRISVIGESAEHVKVRWNSLRDKMLPGVRVSYPRWVLNDPEMVLIWNAGEFTYTATIRKHAEYL